jgi:hypothetical protein
MKISASPIRHMMMAPVAFLIAPSINVAAYASCSDRPGTPAIIGTSLKAPGTLILSFESRTRDTGKICYDIEVKRNGQVAGQSITGGACNLGVFGKTYEHTFSDLGFNADYCFRIRARTEAGTEGCVSQVWSNTVCGTTSNPRLGETAADAACNSYVQDAMLQVQRNATSRNCRLTGPRWSPDRNHHANWCPGATPAARAFERSARQSELARCDRPRGPKV